MILFFYVREYMNERRMLLSWLGSVVIGYREERIVNGNAGVGVYADNE